MRNFKNSKTVNLVFREFIRYQMKITLSFSILTLIFVSCRNSDKVFEYGGSENWGEHYAGNTNTLHQEFKVYSQGNDTLIYFTNYYPNGKMKSKVVMKNDGLWEIKFVLDTLGNKRHFGKLKNGTGYVIEFTDDLGVREHEGKYVNGNKEGWWKHYHFKGAIMDSTLYKEGYDISSQAGNTALDVLIGPPGSMKNNYYR